MAKENPSVLVHIAVGSAAPLNAGTLSQWLKVATPQMIEKEEEDSPVYSIVCKFKKLPQEAKVSVRAVSNVDLNERGGYALMGTFAGRYHDDSGILATSSNRVMVVMIGLPPKDGIEEHSRRAAIVFLPSNTAVSTRLLAADSVSIKSDGLEVEAGVRENGIVLGIYTDEDRKLLSGEQFVQPVRSRNVYYQVAWDLEDLHKAGLVDFDEIAKGVILGHDKSQSIHKQLPNLPVGYKWGPEIAGIMTIQKVMDPYAIFLLDSILDKLDDMHLSERETLLDFAEEQSKRLEAAADTYLLVARTFRDDKKQLT